MPPIYPKSAIALLDARVVAVAWSLIALLPVCWLIDLWLPPLFGWDLFQIHFAVFMSVGVVHIGLSLCHACPQCGRHPTIQGFKKPHPDSWAQSEVLGWGGVVVNILRRRRLVCIHCGAGYRVETPGH
jgi:hypothetical protein